MPDSTKSQQPKLLDQISAFDLHPRLPADTAETLSGIQPRSYWMGKHYQERIGGVRYLNEVSEKVRKSQIAPIITKESIMSIIEKT
jgi:hypothetical protein